MPKRKVEQVHIPSRENNLGYGSEQPSLNTQQQTTATDKFPLDQLPVDLLNGKNESVIKKKTDMNLSRYLSLLDMKALSLTGNKNLFFGFIKESLEANKLIKKFLTHVVLGEKNAAEEMLKKDPGLLLHKAKVVDEAGRTIYGTAYQIALGAKDVSVNSAKFEEMAEMIARYLKQLPNGKVEMEKQRAEQFPEAWELFEAARKAKDSEAINKVFAAIKNAATPKAEQDAVKEFLDYLAEQKKQVITAGFHFNEALFEEALKLYDDNYSAFGGVDSRKNRLAAINVIGSIEKYFTANLAQAACDGFGKVAEGKAPLSRKKLLDDNRTSFFDPTLGVSHFVYSYYGGAYVCAGQLGPKTAFELLFKNLCRAKTSSLEKLCGFQSSRQLKNL